MAETQVDPTEVGADAPDEATESNGAEASPPKTREESVSNLKARVAARRARQGKENGAAGTASTGGNGLSGEANDELAELAAKRGETTSTASVPEGDVMEGLKADAQPGSLYEQRQKEIAEAKARGKRTPASKGKAGARAAAAKAKEKEKAAKEKEKAKAKEKTEKEKAKAAERKEKDKEKQATRKKAEDERKATQAKKKAEAAAKRAEAKVPELIRKENKATQQAFAEDYSLAGPKTDRNPNGLGIRRAKADRGDFCAGYMMALRRVRRDLKTTGTGKTEEASI